jgi:hypothetical protein
LGAHRAFRLLATSIAIAAVVALLPSQSFAAPGELGCDPLDPAVCLQPWPNDFFTTPDSTTDTGLRLNLNPLGMPRNVAGNPIRPDEWNRNDGFSPGQKIVTKVPGLETEAAFLNTGAVPITDMVRTFAPDQPIVVLNTRTGKRHLIWSELDANPANPSDVNLIIRPGRNFDEGTRYIVALRKLRDAQGTIIQPQDAFRTYRDDIPTTDPAVEARRPHMEEIFTTLDRAGIARDQLYLAWDFTTASKRNLSERALSIRNDAFAQLGETQLRGGTVEGSSPQFSVSQVTDYTPAQDDKIARKVDGTFVVPCYLNSPGCPPGSRFAYAPGSSVPLRTPGNMQLANFTCLIPRVAVDGAQVVQSRVSLYGHGLLGSASEITAGNIKSMANEHNFVFCATDWSGMSTQDLPNIGTILADLSNFSSLPDRAQQGFVNFQYLGRLMIHPLGFNSDPAFRFTKSGVTKSVLDIRRLFYDGNSQGGIMGGALTALAVDFNRAVLGVPGMNYSTLLRRSVDFDEYAQVLYANYPSELERPLILSLIQTLWDRGEANGYAAHMTRDPYADTPPHTVLMHMAFGDHQVANVSAEVQARTIGAAVRIPAIDPGRHTDLNPYYGISKFKTYPFSGSGLIVWDSGSPTPPANNTPPRAGADPHSHPRNSAAARLQKSEFLKLGGRIVDVCGPKPCYANGYTGNGQ